MGLLTPDLKYDKKVYYEIKNSGYFNTDFCNFA
jgi:hypothetical protein